MAGNHSLNGTWVTEDEDSNVAFSFSVKDKKPEVSGYCRSSGEAFEISRVEWDGKRLSFVARFPSTDTVTKNVFRVRPDGRLDLELTTFEIWKRKDVKPGEIPEAWKPVPGRTMPFTKVRRVPKGKG